jgi:hypothetical protein
MTGVSTLLLELLREAWVALTGALLIFVLMAILAQVLRAASASVVGARLWVWEALSAGMALLTLALFAFLGIPAILRVVEAGIPAGGGCGVISELGALAAGTIAALAALRMLKALITSATAAAVGGPSVLAAALLETGEAVFGMVLAAAAIPLAARFLGVC